MNIKVNFKKLDPEAITPIYKTDEAAGMDLSALNDVSVKAHQTALVKTGIAIQLPMGFEAQVRPRSGLALKNSITVLNSPGTIDSDYRSDISVILINHSDKVFEVKKGDRIAQLIITPVSRAEMFEVEELKESIRGKGGFGSTGV